MSVQYMETGSSEDISMLLIPGHCELGIFQDSRHLNCTD